jgi:hypothetical protein
MEYPTVAAATHLHAQPPHLSIAQIQNISSRKLRQLLVQNVSYDAQSVYVRIAHV